MNATVIIADDRPDWMIAEDNLMACKRLCKHCRKCSSRFGFDCKVLKGTEIPKFKR